jgi:hypothetical protein
MKAASALLTADDATPQLAAAAVRLALDRADLGQASEVILFLSPEFARHAAAAVTAASRAAGCLQVFGGIAAGVATEQGWAMDRPAAAALVIGELPANRNDDTADDGSGDAAPRASLCGNLHLPVEWAAPRTRFGLLYSDSLSSQPTPVWQGARIAHAGHAELAVPGCSVEFAVSTGIAVQAERWRVDEAAANELVRVVSLRDGASAGAASSLKHALPIALREQRPLPIHLAGAWVEGVADRAARLVPLLSANADGSITLAESLPPGTVLSWATRLPATAEADMQRQVDALSARCDARPPAFGLFLSCIGRGPFFYAGPDRDLDVVQGRFPGLPLIGAYGSGQIVPGGESVVLLQNTVITALYFPRS